MGRDNILSIINDANEDRIYLCDLETYELIYLSPATCRVIGVSEQDYPGQKCYKLLQGLDTPCPFCTNSKLTKTGFYTWEHYNASLGRQYMLRDRLVEYRGRLVRMEIATDITHQQGSIKKLAQLQAIDEALVMCIDTLKNGEDTECALNSLLAYIGMFYQADQAYIYEINAAVQALTLTYSWIRGNFSSQHRYKLELSRAAGWFDAFDATGFLSIASVEEEVAHDSLAYQILHAQKIHRLLAAPLLNRAGDPIGLIGVGNPSANVDTPQLLRSVSTFIVDGISKRSMLERLERLSYSDALTGLSNRARYLERVRDLQVHSPPSLGIICLDIDGIGLANDTYGHAYGDTILVRTANILTSLCSQDVYRVGGDQFVVLCPGIGQESFQFLTERLRRTVQDAADLSVSIGSKWTQGQSDAAEEIAHTNKLMSLEKRSHYQFQRTHGETYHVRMMQKLSQEIQDGQFSVVLQPQIRLKTGEMVGAEALVRKRGSAGELVSPAMFIPFYEEEGLVQAIDFFVLETVCQTLRDWADRHIALPRVSVNFSRVTMMEKHFVRDVEAICGKYCVSPRQIGIEITESSSKMDVQVLSLLVKQLRASGFSVSLDDFGAQYSNLAILTMRSVLIGSEYPTKDTPHFLLPKLGQRRFRRTAADPGCTGA